MPQCNYWNVNYIMFQWFTTGLFSKDTKNVNVIEFVQIEDRTYEERETVSCLLNRNDIYSFHWIINLQVVASSKVSKMKI